jgi:hypothetical protein
MYDLVDAVLSMKLDVFHQEEVQDPDTGAIKRYWSYYKTLPCHAKGVVGNSTTSRSGDNQIFNNRYTNEQTVVVRTIERLTIREKITNIKSADGTLIWVELDYPENTSTVYEVMGSTPLTDPFGNVIAYNSTLKRSENQQIGI